MYCFLQYYRKRAEVNKPCKVEISRFAAKQIGRIPKHIQQAIFIWIDAVENQGLSMTMKLRGYHDEPLQGRRKGQRSIRLNRSYRLIYEIHETFEVTILGVIEVNKHEY